MVLLCFFAIISISRSLFNSSNNCIEKLNNEPNNYSVFNWQTKEWENDLSILKTEMELIRERNESLETATRQIAAAMGKGQTRGQYGEMQLEQLLKHAGLLEGTHFKRQDSRTSDMIFNINHCVWYISQFMELKAGDIINTGTPEGVGMGHKPEKYCSIHGGSQRAKSFPLVN